MPSHQESKLTATFLQSNGFGHEFPPSDMDPKNFRRQLTSFLNHRDSANHTLDVAKVLAARALPEAGAQLLQALRRITQGGGDVVAAPLAAPLS
jgi:hypothetical protein